MLETVDALQFFLPHLSGARVNPLGQGNINDTWLVDLPNGHKRVLQRLHRGVFPDPTALMANIRYLTEHLRRMAPSPPLVFYRLLSNPEGKDLYLDPAGYGWRLLTYIDRTRTLQTLEHRGQAREIGSLLGSFHHLTADIDTEILTDLLPDLHNTPRYLEQYDTWRDTSGKSTRWENFCHQYIEQQRPTADLLERNRQELTNRVIHGDPKTSNVLFAAERDQAVSLIDFDTVKPGLLLHDLGDCLRSCCNREGEACREPRATTFDADYFQALLTGYMQSAGHLLVSADRALLVESVKLISFELGVRFFTDHLNGNQYFKVKRDGQNLDRALVQFHLNQSIRDQQGDLEQRFRKLCRSVEGYT
ncbi:phosphotransferase enzyme family protein [Desulfobulbus alkaliphilus]|uniref:phosphotransferase enzyme family protein n=1 Tax=Desulfobulbus alkaliphilus TaxID=869814 RepID=UPI0019631283|nr:aminoglycoside phosphotransferase family protein [Desulfobulbus alkaliphilus]MBM9536716.1 aminoglycoside phosphotransferase family protein [Desulfobulbus alkaliphilus]